jgi:hypothetical protein
LSTKPAKAIRSDKKKDIALALLRRDQGATLAEIAKATEWQTLDSAALSAAM